mgnify:CR=1 FL=1
MNAMRKKIFKQLNKRDKMETATFAMGCFWKPQFIFSQVPGVKSTTVGYTGGKVNNPNYRQVCSDTTGHAEAIEIVYDPKRISYNQLLEVFWNNHDPTQMNRQGPDVGTQYRSAIFYHDEEQKKVAEQSKQEIEKKLKIKVVTEVIQADIFYKAEDYHQNYLTKNKGKVCY